MVIILGSDPRQEEMSLLNMAGKYLYTLSAAGHVWNDPENWPENGLFFDMSPTLTM